MKFFIGVIKVIVNMKYFILVGSFIVLDIGVVVFILYVKRSNKLWFLLVYKLVKYVLYFLFD